MNRTFVLLAGILLAAGFRAQEFVRPLSANINYIYTSLGPQKTASQPVPLLHKGTSASLPLPFKDDFSYAPYSYYASGDLWTDSMVYVNTGFAIAPLSIGVATFDGLNKHGYPYTANIANLQLSSKADTLTSRPINLFTAGSQTLQPSDSVALSFYYQAGGRGDYPENSDSLVLDFFMPSQNKWALGKWNKVGPNTPNFNDTLFKRAFIWISDTAFLQDNFRFRLRNYATTSGDFDHWNVDYVYLDKNRSQKADTSYFDVTFGEMPTPFLQNYSAMPHEQFTENEMASRVSVKLRNNYTQALNCNYNYAMEYDINNSLVKTYSNFDNIKPFNSSGYDNFQGVANPSVEAVFKNVDRNLDFAIKHVVSPSSGSAQEFITRNDTLVQYQRLRNYYAFDDGSAEAGYYILGAGGKMAVKIRLNNPDEILGAAIYFQNVGTSTTKQTFTFSVWSDGQGVPGSLLFSDTARAVYKNSGFREIPVYTLSASKAQRTLQPGTYYIGFKQGVQAGISVGLDLNYDHHTSLYFDSGSGWSQSQVFGSIMIQPIFGSFDGVPIGLYQTLPETREVRIFPNPCNETLSIDAGNLTGTARVLDIAGRVLRQEALDPSGHVMNTAGMDSGIYFLELSRADGALVHRRKIIISH